MAEHAFDLVVIGGGPGGYVAAIRGAQLGMKVGLVEQAHLGGICLNWGCIPTKSLLKTADVYRTVLHANRFGVRVGSVTVDLAAAVQRSRDVSAQLAGGVARLLKKNHVTVFDGRGRLNGPGRVQVTSPGAVSIETTAPHVILATGARARTLAGLDPARRLVWTSREAMVPEELPGSLMVVGSGAIGIEFASFFNALGVDVTVAESLSQILPTEDAEIASYARTRFEQSGMTIHTGTKVVRARSDEQSVTVHLTDGGGAVREMKVDRVISAVGVIGNVEDLGLETTSVRVEGGVIETDGLCRTAEPGVYAIGDVAGPPMLAHKAQHEAVICVDAIAGLEHVSPLERDHIPGCVYSHPQVASVGLTEDEARTTGHEVKVGRFPFLGNGKAITLGESDGLVKTVFDAATGQLLGAHLVGAEVSELIQGFVVAMNLESTEAELMRTVFPHPTLTEAVHESVLSAYGAAIHI